MVGINVRTMEFGSQCNLQMTLSRMCAWILLSKKVDVVYHDWGVIYCYSASVQVVFFSPVYVKAFTMGS